MHIGVNINIRELDMMPQTQWRMCHVQDRSALLTLFFSPGDRVRRVRRMGLPLFGRSTVFVLGPHLSHLDINDSIAFSPL